MLLAVDIGNSSISGALFSGDTLLEHLSLPVNLQKPAQNYGNLFVERLYEKGIALPKIRDIAIASVVGHLSLSLSQTFRSSWGKAPLVITYRDVPELKICYHQPERVGIDRLLAALAAYKTYGAPLVVVDIGTAITVDFLSSEGEFRGGIIAPGPRICAEALAEKTNLLPLVEPHPPSELIGQSTEEAIKSGIVYGTADLIDGLVKRIREQTGVPAKVVATGGFVDLISPESETIEIVDPYLVLKGIQLSYSSLKKHS